MPEGAAAPTGIPPAHPHLPYNQHLPHPLSPNTFSQHPGFFLLYGSPVMMPLNIPPPLYKPPGTPPPPTT